MKEKILFYLIIAFFAVGIVNSQDTFSIVAIDTISGEAGSAGASCVDMDNFPGYPDDFLGELFPNLGAINTQAWYQPTNQANARNRMNLGDTPAEIIDWLIANDVSSQPQLRQYGIVAFVEGHPQSAAHTGIATDDYKNHVLGPNYSIQGNILLGQVVLDSMEARFLRAEGDLACKLMAALQGANMTGADSRCASNGTSSLFAFVKVAQPDDVFGEPSFMLSVRTHANAGIEPIDSLQVKFDAVHECSGLGLSDETESILRYEIYPNPASEHIFVKSLIECSELSIINMLGAEVYREEGIQNSGLLKIDISELPEGLYIVNILDGERKTILSDIIIKN